MKKVLLETIVITRNVVERPVQPMCVKQQIQKNKLHHTYLQLENDIFNEEEIECSYLYLVALGSVAHHIHLLALRKFSKLRESFLFVTHGAPILVVYRQNVT